LSVTSRTGIPTLPRRLAPGITWLGGCHKTAVYGEEMHVHHSNYLIQGQRSLLIDTGFPSTWPQVDAHLTELLDARPLDFVFPTHSEIPHSGNLNKLLAGHPETTVIGDLRDFHLYFPEHVGRMRQVGIGDEIDLGAGYRVVFLEAVFRDLPNTLWAYERSQRMMFVADGFAYSHRPSRDTGRDGEVDDYYHAPDECALTSEELPPVQVGQMSFIVRAALNWSRYVDVKPLFATVADLLENQYPTRIVGPAHGNVIVNLEKLMPVVRQAYTEVYEGAG
jgi:glyoxylase-like metal-dependent hydrolase (beta-lactamase superfamily II)